MDKKGTEHNELCVVEKDRTGHCETIPVDDLGELISQSLWQDS